MFYLLHRYFLWDTIDAIVNFTDLGFVFHGLACVVTYSLTFVSLFPHLTRWSVLMSTFPGKKPCLQYFTCRFLLWELCVSITFDGCVYY